MGFAHLNVQPRRGKVLAGWQLHRSAAIPGLLGADISVRVQSTLPLRTKSAVRGPQGRAWRMYERGHARCFCIKRAAEENGMNRNEKTEVVSELHASLKEMGVVVVTRNLGLTVAQSTQLRQKMRDVGATFKVTKNKLAKIAIKDTDYAALSDMFVGPVGLATSPDPIAAAKVVIDFAKTNDKLEIIGGAMGATLLDAAGIKALASLPSLDQLRASLVGLIQAPATKLATVTQAPGAQLARVFNAYATKEAA